MEHADLRCWGNHLKNKKTTDRMRSMSFQDTRARSIRKACSLKCFRERLTAMRGGPIGQVTARWSISVEIIYMMLILSFLCKPSVSVQQPVCNRGHPKGSFLWTWIHSQGLQVLPVSSLSDTYSTSTSSIHLQYTAYVF